MLALGVNPQVASATAACMVLFTSFTATTTFYIFGLIIQNYAIVCLILGFSATFIGQQVMSSLMRRYNRNSYIAFSIGIVVTLSAICMTLESIISILSGTSSSAHTLCSSAD